MKLRTVVFAAILLIVFAAPADAKGPTELQVTGDGIAGVIVIRPADNPARWSRLLESSRFFEIGLDPGIGGGVDRRIAQGVPVAGLGPRLRLTWIVSGGGFLGETVHFLQDLYPFAPDGPRLHTPAGQTLYGRTAGSGVHRVDATLLTTLHRAGVPDPSTDDPPGSPLRLVGCGGIARW